MNKVKINIAIDRKYVESLITLSGITTDNVVIKDSYDIDIDKLSFDESAKLKVAVAGLALVAISQEKESVKCKTE